MACLGKRDCVRGMGPCDHCAALHDGGERHIGVSSTAAHDPLAANTFPVRRRSSEPGPSRSACGSSSRAASWPQQHVPQEGLSSEAGDIHYEAISHLPWLGICHAGLGAPPNEPQNSPELMNFSYVQNLKTARHRKTIGRASRCRGDQKHRSHTRTSSQSINWAGQFHWSFTFRRRIWGNRVESTEYFFFLSHDFLIATNDFGGIPTSYAPQWAISGSGTDRDLLIDGGYLDAWERGWEV